MKSDKNNPKLLNLWAGDQISYSVVQYFIWSSVLKMWPMPNQCYDKVNKQLHMTEMKNDTLPQTGHVSLLSIHSYIQPRWKWWEHFVIILGFSGVYSA